MPQPIIGYSADDKQPIHDDEEQLEHQLIQEAHDKTVGFCFLICILSEKPKLHTDILLQCLLFGMEICTRNNLNKVVSTMDICARNSLGKVVSTCQNTLVFILMVMNITC